MGHSPFGHKGEVVLNEICKRDIGTTFWHEKNGVHFVDDIELLEDDKGDLRNLNLTYAVRDGIISHCGEIDENALKPRNEFIDLDDPRLAASNEYFSLIINRIYVTLKSCYNEGEIYKGLSKVEKFYPDTIATFKDWLYKYSDLTDRAESNLKNNIVYSLSKGDEKEYYKAIVDFIAGMTDNYAIDVYNEILRF